MNKDGKRRKNGKGTTKALFTNEKQEKTRENKNTAHSYNGKHCKLREIT